MGLAFVAAACRLSDGVPLFEKHRLNRIASCHMPALTPRATPVHADYTALLHVLKAYIETLKAENARSLPQRPLIVWTTTFTLFLLTTEQPVS